MKTKYIKVSVSERLPKKTGWYVTYSKLDVPHQTYFNGEKFKDEFQVVETESFLEEVPDREDEMREMLKEARTIIARMKRSMLVHPDHEEGSEFDDLTTSAQDMENQIGEFLTN